MHKKKNEASILIIEKEGLSWYYEITKFLELEAYPVGADKRECHSIWMMAMQYIIYKG